MAPRVARARGRRDAAHGERRLPGLLPRPRRGDRRHPRRRAAPLPPLAGGQDVRVIAATRVRGRLVRVLRHAARRPAGAEAALEARPRPRDPGHRRAGRAAVRRGGVPAGRQGPLRAPRRAPAGGDGHGDPHQSVDDRCDPRGGAPQAGRVHVQDRLPRRVARLHDADAGARLVRRQPAACRAVRARPPVRTPRAARRQGRVAAPAAHRQRVLPPAAQRDRVPGRHPPAAVLLGRRGRRDQLRRDRHGHRARDHPRVRRPGLAVRRDGRAAQLVDRGGPHRVHAPGGGPRAAVQRVTGDRRRDGQRQAHAGREHRRPGRARDRVPRVPGCAPRRRADGRTA